MLQLSWTIFTLSSVAEGNPTLDKALKCVASYWLTLSLCFNAGQIAYVEFIRAFSFLASCICNISRNVIKSTVDTVEDNYYHNKPSRRLHRVLADFLSLCLPLSKVYCCFFTIKDIFLYSLVTKLSHPLEPVPAAMGNRWDL